MPRYTIDTDDAEHAVQGDGKVSFDCLQKAHAEAHKVLGLMAQDVLPDGEHRVFSARVRDEDGREVYQATLTLHGEWKVAPPG
jgi:hypothetical protein